VIELPAVFLGTSVGLRLGVHGWRRLKGKADKTLLAELADGLRIYFTVILPLLLVAAAVEVYVTPLIVSLSQ